MDLQQNLSKLWDYIIFVGTILSSISKSSNKFIFQIFGDAKIIR